ncbi:MAG TPA: sigma-70 family RNA polymerase sigma factor [bacterium]
MSVTSDRRVIDRDRMKRFEILALPVMNKLYNTAIRMTHDRNDAEDLVQDTYLKAWRYFDRFELGTNFHAWIFRIMVNNFINAYRKNLPQSKRSDFELTFQKVSNSDSVELPAGDAIHPHVDYHSLFDDYISTALEKLPSQFRLVVLLSDVNDLKYKEIAEVLDCPIGTVMSRLNRGRQMLMKSLQGYAQSNGYVACG